MKTPSHLVSLFIALSCAASGIALAQTASNSSISKSGPSQLAPNINHSLDAALANCAKTVSKDANGRPDQSAMQECMRSKGFAPPAGAPSGNVKSAGK